MSLAPPAMVLNATGCALLGYINARADWSAQAPCETLDTARLGGGRAATSRSGLERAACQLRSLARSRRATCFTATGVLPCSQVVANPCPVDDVAV